MNVFLIFAWVYAAMIAMSFWEAYSEGRNAWHRGKLGWKVRIGGYYFTAYHFYLSVVMLPLLLTLPLAIYGWNLRLFGILLSAYSSGLVIEDFMWYAVNPSVRISEFNSRFGSHYPWLKIGRFEIPLIYIAGFSIASLSWFFIWR